MAYSKTTWVTGDTITAALLNHGETQYDEAAADLTTHKTAATLDHPDGSVNDTKIGTRTVDQAIVDAYSNTGTLTQLLSWIAKTILAMKGSVTNWYDAAAASISTIWAKFDASTGHKHTGAAGDGPLIPNLGAPTGSGSASIAADSEVTITHNLGRIPVIVLATDHIDYATHIRSVSTTTFVIRNGWSVSLTANYWYW